MQTSPRSEPIELLVVHDNEGFGTAQGLADYLQTIDGGYHATVDNAGVIVCAADNLSVWGAGGVNSRSLHICFIGFAAWSRAEWLQHLGANTISNAAQWLAQKCVAYGIPAHHLTPREVGTPGVKGICTHGDVTAAGYTASEGHTDPGPNFPLDLLITATVQKLNPGPPPLSPAEKARLVAIDAWRHRVHAKALQFGDQNHDVAILINALRRKKFLKWWVRGDKYGTALRTGVVKFKNAQGGAFAAQPAPAKGEIFGGDAADALVALG